MPRPKKKYMEKYMQPSQPVVALPAPAPEPWPAYMDYHTAAKYVSETYWTIRNLVKDGKLIAKKLGRRHTVSREQLEELWRKTKAA